MFRCLLPLIAFTAACAADPHLPPGTQPLPSAAEGGRGPLALVNLNHHVLGAATVHGGRFPDLFLAGFGGPQKVHLFRWVDTAKSGAPVFAQPVEVKCGFKDKGTVFQATDGGIHGLWISKAELVHTVFDREALEFRETARLPLPKEVGSPSSLTALANADGSYDLAFEVTNGAKGLEGKNSTEEWRPFNSSGIARGDLRYKYLKGVRLPSLFKGPMGPGTQITRKKEEVYFSMHQITGVNLGKGHGRDLITGSRQGNLVFYANLAATGFKLEPRRLVAGHDGNALRHPSINPSVCAYPNAQGLSDIIACGEGSLYFYRFTGKFTAAGAPMYAEPVSVLQEKADLYAGTLPTPTTADWNGDGALDILVGNSEGFVLFFENIGSSDAPRFLPATRVQAGGREIQVQAGYSGSLQGLQEARWGYLSPNVVDWNEDGLLDIVTGDITGNYLVYLNRGSQTKPRLDPAHPLYCDGLDLRGMWRVRPAVGKIAGRMALALVDGEDHFHLYWRVDDYNVEDGGKLGLSDGQPIGASGGVGGMSGRCKLDLFDWNQDGLLDLIIGTARVNSIPDRETGLPMPGIAPKTLGTPLLMLNTGTAEKPRFARPVPFRDENGTLIQPGGAHETGAVGTWLGGAGPNLLICNEAGRLFLLPGKKLLVK
ncbi:MAG: VCBS repeat-containing protein [Verrucomicrobiota bacterium]